MPFKSEAQRRHMWATDPEMAARWEKETPPGPLPEHVGDVKKPKSKVKPAGVKKVKRAGK